MTAFELDARIAGATLPLAESGLCLFRLMNDRRYPWVVMIPRRGGVTDLFGLDAQDRHALVDNAALIAGLMTTAFGADTTNVATLGNRVRQFHLHVIARRTADAAWPNGVWDGSPALPYDPLGAEAALELARTCLPPLP